MSQRVQAPLGRLLDRLDLGLIENAFCEFDALCGVEAAAREAVRLDPPPRRGVSLWRLTEALARLDRVRDIRKAQ